MRIALIIATLLVAVPALAQLGVPSFDGALLRTITYVQGCGYFHAALKPALTEEYLALISRTAVDWPTDIWSPPIYSEAQIKKDWSGVPSFKDCELIVEKLAAKAMDGPAIEGYRIRQNR